MALPYVKHWMVQPILDMRYLIGIMMDMKYMIGKLVLLSSMVVLIGCNKNGQMAALKVSSTPQTKVYVDGREVGTTPYKSTDLEPGEITLRLVDVNNENVTWEGLIDVLAGVETVVNQSVADSVEKTAGEILTLESGPQTSTSLIVISDPDAAVVKLDGESKGFAPIELNQIAAGVHELSLASPGYQNRTIQVDAQLGYKLVANVKLA
jgi:hypothetical protein